MEGIRESAASLKINLTTYPPGTPGASPSWKTWLVVEVVCASMLMHPSASGCAERGKKSNYLNRHVRVNGPS